MIHHLWLTFLHITGADDESGNWYGFWSGFGSDLGELGIIVIAYRHLVCHVHGCLRLGRHHPSTNLLICKKHYERI
jgi:hypothetical protein